MRWFRVSSYIILFIICSIAIASLGIVFASGYTQTLSYGIYGSYTCVLRNASVEEMNHSVFVANYTLILRAAVRKGFSYSINASLVEAVLRQAHVRRFLYTLYPRVSCIYEYGCIIYDMGRVVATPTDPWVFPGMRYRVPIVYLNVGQQPPYIIIINYTDIKRWIIGNGTVALALGSTPIDPKYVHVYVANATEAKIKVGIKPSWYGGTCDDVWIRIGSTWIKPYRVEPSSGGVCYGYFDVSSYIGQKITAVGMHHTSAGWGDPTYVVIYDAVTGAKLFETSVGGHVWSDGIYGRSYFEYVSISYTIPNSILRTLNVVEVVINTTLNLASYGYLYLYYYTTGGKPIEYKTGIDRATEFFTPCNITQVYSEEYMVPTITPPPPVPSLTLPSPPTFATYVPGPRLVFARPSIVSPQGLMMLALFLGLFIIYSRRFGWALALSMSGAISTIISLAMFGFDIASVFLVLTLIGLALWRLGVGG